MSSIRLSAFSPATRSTEATLTKPSSVISIAAPVSSVIARMVTPPLPITSRILAGSIFNVKIRGAKSDISLRAVDNSAFMFSKICSLPPLACSSALDIISGVMPWILISICSAVTPESVPDTLKSISPK